MSQDNPGLFDASPNRRQVRFAVAMVGLLCAAALLILPVSGIRLRSMDPFVPVIDAIMFVCELIIATMLYAQDSVFGRAR